MRTVDMYQQDLDDIAHMLSTSILRLQKYLDMEADEERFNAMYADLILLKSIYSNIKDNWED